MSETEKKTDDFVPESDGDLENGEISLDNGKDL